MHKPMRWVLRHCKLGGKLALIGVSGGLAMLAAWLAAGQGWAPLGCRWACRRWRACGSCMCCTASTAAWPHEGGAPADGDGARSPGQSDPPHHGPRGTMNWREMARLLDSMVVALSSMVAEIRSNAALVTQAGHTLTARQPGPGRAHRAAGHERGADRGQRGAGDGRGAKQCPSGRWTQTATPTNCARRWSRAAA